LTNPSYWRTPLPSTTFHGRDLFAPVGAHLANGVPLRELGTDIDLSTIVQLPIPDLIRTGSTVQGVIQAIDHFGNLITTIPGADVSGKPWSVRIENATYPGKATYSESAPGEILALVGSHGWIEVAANRANAQTQLNLKWGSVLSVVINGC
jgi:S-adenosylmethionine hydrolase